MDHILLEVSKITVDIIWIANQEGLSVSIVYFYKIPDITIEELWVMEVSLPLEGGLSNKNKGLSDLLHLLSCWTLIKMRQTLSNYLCQLDLHFVVMIMIKLRHLRVRYKFLLSIKFECLLFDPILLIH